VATTNNAIYLPALATLGAGVRYHLTLLAHPWTARLDGFNLTNASGLHVSNLYLLLPEQSRRFMLTLAIDLYKFPRAPLPAFHVALKICSRTCRR
jgi:hypothetical protein